MGCVIRYAGKSYGPDPALGPTQGPDSRIGAQAHNRLSVCVSGTQGRVQGSAGQEHGCSGQPGRRRKPAAWLTAAEDKPV